MWTEQFAAAADYMRLPASQYSVLDAKKIERLDDDTFICYVGGLNFLGFVVEPVLTVSVIVQDRGPVVKLLDTKVAHLAQAHESLSLLYLQKVTCTVSGFCCSAAARLQDDYGSQ